MVNEHIIKVINEYTEALKGAFTIDKVFLFGSFSKGISSETSDIDIAVIIKGKVDYEDELKAMKLRRNIDLRIEPHLFSLEELENSNPFLEEIIRKGVKVA
ncbi:MAG: nucleotidyltransferase domain-containing protein [Thermotogota bacterium]|nr:nucleotidyltransferase domain-containing protein [Thermotogota bacterium]